MEHPLALAVLNDSKHYDKRVANARSMSSKKYAAYIRGLVIEEARVQRIKFQVRSTQADIDQSVTDVVDTMRTQIAEWSGSPDPADPDNVWIDDDTGERRSARTGELLPPAGFLPQRLEECDHG